MTIFLTWIFLCQINKGRALNLLLLVIEVENKTLQSICRPTFHTVSLFWWCWCLAWSYFLQDAALFLQICITKMIIPNIHVETLGGFKPSETYVCQIGWFPQGWGNKSSKSLKAPPGAWLFPQKYWHRNIHFPGKHLHQNCPPKLVPPAFFPPNLVLLAQKWDISPNFLLLFNIKHI